MNHPISIILFWAAAQTGAMDDTTNLIDNRGRVEIIFSDEQISYSFAIDRFKPEEDSCVDLFVSFRKTPGAWACFRYDEQRAWQFENIGYYDSSQQHGVIKVNSVLDNEGHFLRGTIFVNTDVDSSPRIRDNITRRGDIPIFGDTASASFDFSFERKSYFCAPRPKITVVQRKFTYPPDYMRREPVLNYPELSMFHYGSTVRLPTPGSVNERGFLINYWHILHPSELEYDDKPKVKNNF